MRTVGQCRRLICSKNIKSPNGLGPQTLFFVIPRLKISLRTSEINIPRPHHAQYPSKSLLSKPPSMQGQRRSVSFSENSSSRDRSIKYSGNELKSFTKILSLWRCQIELS